MKHFENLNSMRLYEVVKSDGSKPIELLLNSSDANRLQDLIGDNAIVAEVAVATAKVTYAIGVRDTEKRDITPLQNGKGWTV